MENGPKPVDFEFKVSDIVLAYHGTLLYEAEILGVNKHPTTNVVLSYVVHYQGFKKSWESIVPRASVFEHNDDNLRVAHRLLQGAKMRQQAIRPIEQGTPQPRSSEDDSGTDSMPKPEANGESASVQSLFHLPSALKRQLVDDWEFVTKENRLVKLPRDIAVDEIIHKWITSYKDPENMARREVADGIHSYFNAALSTMLLYKFERPQYNEKFHGAGDADEEINPSQVYGAEHLLRLLLKLPYMLETTGVDIEMMRRIAEHVNELTKYMQKNGRILFMPEYEAASDEYMAAAAKLTCPPPASASE